MTRETKVGLLVGTGLILLAGIVVGDRLSTQKRDQQPTPDSADYADGNMGGSGNPVGLPQSPGTSGNRATLFGNRSAEGPNNGIGNRADNGNGGRDIRLNNGNFNNNRRTGSAHIIGQAGDNTNGNGNTNGGRNTEDGNRSSGTGNKGNTGDRTNGNGNGNTNVPPRPKIVKIKAGQTLSDIAREHMGSGSYKNIKLIVAANPTRIRNADIIREGIEIVIPITHLANSNNGGTTSGNGARVTPGPTNNNGGRAVPPPPAPAPSNTRTYKVLAGDSLIRIARNKLGGASKWKALHKLNKSKVPEPRDLREGMVLILPAATSP